MARVPPNDADAEMALLGSLLLDGEMVGAVVPLLRPDDFYRSANRRLYEVVLSLYERREPTDPLLVLRECERLESMSGTVCTILAVQTSAPCSPCMNWLKRQASRWRRDSPFSASVILSHHCVPKRGWISSGIPTGFFQLDDLTAGLHPGELVIVAGRPSMGKTTFALNVAYNVAVSAKVPTAVFSLEMSRQQITKNILCSHAMVEAHKLRGGRFLDDARAARLDAGHAGKQQTYAEK